MSLKNKIKTLLYEGLNFSFGHFSVKRAAILMYHSIDYNKASFTVKPENFRKQMDYLYKKDYNIISINQLLEYFRAENIPAKSVVLTFDDGYQDNFFNVFPILKKYNFPATIFLTTDFIGKEYLNSAGISLKILNWDQIKEMYNSGLIDFEPHSLTHLKLTKISLNAAEREILQSKRVIEENLRKKCDFFSYPYGVYNPKIVEILKKHNFKAAVLVKKGLVSKNDNPFLLKRNSIDALVDCHQFKGKISFFNKYI